jgi:Zn-dependent protease
MIGLEMVVAAALGMVLHEAAHASAAYAGGDPTGYFLGRLTLNPLRHLDPAGSFLVPLCSYLLAGIVVGWGRPVPINRRALSRSAYIAALAAGPAANLWLAAVCWIGGLDAGAVVNLVLAAINLVPVDPLDGGRILEEFRS